MPSLKDVNGIPTLGKNLIIVAALNSVLHFRIFDDESNMVVDHSEEELEQLTGQAQQIEDLKEQLKDLWPPHQLTSSEKVRGIIVVTSIVGHARASVEDGAILEYENVALMATWLSSTSRWMRRV